MYSFQISHKFYAIFLNLEKENKKQSCCMDRFSRPKIGPNPSAAGIWFSKPKWSLASDTVSLEIGPTRSLLFSKPACGLGLGPTTYDLISGPSHSQVTRRAYPNMGLWAYRTVMRPTSSQFKIRTIQSLPSKRALHMKGTWAPPY